MSFYQRVSRDALRSAGSHSANFRGVGRFGPILQNGTQPTGIYEAGNRAFPAPATSRPVTRQTAAWHAVHRRFAALPFLLKNKKPPATP
jgi:hypothetical protein